jgi:hypothetical protein
MKCALLRRLAAPISVLWLERSQSLGDIIGESNTRGRYVFKTAAAECDADRLNDFGDIEHFPPLEFSQREPIPEDYVLTSVLPHPLQ